MEDGYDSTNTSRRTRVVHQLPDELYRLSARASQRHSLHDLADARLAVPPHCQLVAHTAAEAQLPVGHHRRADDARGGQQEGVDVVVGGVARQADVAVAVGREEEGGQRAGGRTVGERR